MSVVPYHLEASLAAFCGSHAQWFYLDEVLDDFYHRDHMTPVSGDAITRRRSGLESDTP